MVGALAGLLRVCVGWASWTSYSLGKLRVTPCHYILPIRARWRAPIQAGREARIRVACERFLAAPRRIIAKRRPGAGTRR